MNLPLLLMALPVVYGIPAYWMYRCRPQATSLGATALLLLLAWMAATVPFGEPVTLLGVQIPVAHSFEFLGRQFAFLPTLRPAVAFVFCVGAAFLATGAFVSTPPAFFPVSLTFLGLMGASLFVQPFLFAAIFLFLAAALFTVSSPNPSARTVRGFSRLLVFSALSMPFLLLAGAELSAQAGLPPEENQVRSLVLLLSFGFALLFGVPPFHFWKSDLAEAAYPVPAAFLHSLFIGSVFFFLVRFPAEFDWIRFSTLPFEIFRWGGLFLCLFGALAGLLQSRFGRLMSSAGMINLGIALLMLSAFTPETMALAYALLVVRSLSFLLWSVASGTIQAAGSGAEDLRGVMRTQPLAGAAMLFAGLSLVGFPGLMAFPAYWGAIRSLSTGYFPSEAHSYIILVAASLTLGMYAVLRFAQTMFRPVEETTPARNTGNQLQLFFVAGIILLILIGLFPQLLYPQLESARMMIPDTIPLR